MTNLFHLLLSLTGFCCFGKKEIVAHYDILLQSATPSAQSVEKTVPFVLDCNNEDYSKAKVSRLCKGSAVDI